MAATIPDDSYNEVEVSLTSFSTAVPISTDNDIAFQHIYSTSDNPVEDENKDTDGWELVFTDGTFHSATEENQKKPKKLQTSSSEAGEATKALTSPSF